MRVLKLYFSEHEVSAILNGILLQSGLRGIFEGENGCGPFLLVFIVICRHMDRSFGISTSRTSSGSINTYQQNVLCKINTKNGWPVREIVNIRNKLCNFKPWFDHCSFHAVSVAKVRCRFILFPI